MAALNSGFYWLAILGIINSLISVWYYIYVIVTMYMKPGEKELPAVSFTPTLLVAVLVALILTLQLGIFPDSYLKFADLSGEHVNLLSIFQSILNSM